MNIEARFWSKVDKGSSCWLWRAKARVKGYGRFYANGKDVLAHRFAYELLVGGIPRGLIIDHICRNHACVNPKHLRVVTNRENILAGVGPTVINAMKAHCKHGHPLDGKNTRLKVERRGKQRICKKCSTLWMAKANANRPRAEYAAYQRRYYQDHKAEIVAKKRRYRQAEARRAVGDLERSRKVEEKS